MSRSSVQLFGIETVGNYLVLCTAAVDELKEQQDSVLKGFTAILALNHLPDWLEHKVSAERLARVGIVFHDDLKKKRCTIESANHDLKLVWRIANGFKHLRPVHSTQRIAGYGTGLYGIGPYGAPYLLIDLGDDKEPSERWCVGLNLCQRVLAWWQETLLPIIGAEDI